MSDDAYLSDGPALTNGDRSSETAVDRLQDEVDRLQLDYVRFTFADLHGIARCKSVPRRHVQHCLTTTGGVTVFAG